MTFSPASYSAIETKAERRERQASRARGAARRIRGMSEDVKVQLLGLAIATAYVQRGTVSLLDLTQAGFAEAEAKRLYDPALAHARTIEPALMGIAA